MGAKRRVLSVAAAVVAAGGSAWAAQAPDRPRVRSIALPGAPATGGVGMDFIGYDPARGRVWVPAGNTGSVDVIDVATETVTRIEGFATKDVERDGRKRTMGPSSVAIADGTVFVGNRGDDTICALDAVSLKRGPCLKLDSMPDAIAFVPAVKEVWVTTQANDSVVVLDASSAGTLTVKQAIVLPGSPECFAVDGTRGRVYTNLEDKDRTLSIDVKTHKVLTDWPSGCGEAGPRGLALDEALDLLFVACTTGVHLLDSGHGGKPLGSLDVGEGVDALEYAEAHHRLFAAAGRAGRMVVAGLGPGGRLSVEETIATAPGARNAVVTEKGVAYLTDARGGAILVVDPAR